MKKIALICMVLMLIAFASCEKPAQAEEIMLVEGQGLSLTMPFETGVTAFWFPSDNTIAGGISETFLRVKYVDVNHPTLSKFSIDLDGTLAQEINEGHDSLYGIGIKVNYKIAMESPTGIAFEPSIGITALRNLRGINVAGDIFRDYKLAIYGNIVLYKF